MRNTYSTYTTSAKILKQVKAMKAETVSSSSKNSLVRHKLKKSRPESSLKTHVPQAQQEVSKPKMKSFKKKMVRRPFSAKPPIVVHGTMSVEEFASE
jgi:hypothetical protein